MTVGETVTPEPSTVALRRPRWPWVAGIVAIVLLAALVWGWTSQSSDY